MDKSLKFRRTWLGAASVALAVSAWGFSASPAHAADWPSKPVRLIVCFPPGNAADVLARSIEPLLSQRLGQPVVVDNRGGAGGVIGVDAVAKAPADGHTLSVCSLSPITIIPSTRRKMPYDPIRDLAPVMLTNKGPLIMVVKKESPFNTLEELVQFSKAHPGKLSYASLGPGTVSQMTTEAFKAASGAQLTEVSYKGSGQALTDLIGGHIDVMLDGAASAAGQIAAGTVKALGVTTVKRSAIAPNVTTFDERGVPGLKGFDLFGWVGIFAPAGTPPEIVARLNREVTEIMKDPQVVQRAHAAGQEVAEANSPEQFRAFIKNDLSRWTALARKLNIETTE